MLSRVATLLMVLLSAGAARADRGALSLELGGGGGILLLHPPRAVLGQTLPTTAWQARVGLRYAFSDDLEVTVGGFFEPRVDAYHQGVTIDTSAPGYSGPDSGRGEFTGTLAHTVERYGGAVGIRRVWGSVLRLHVGGDIGWARRSYAAVDLLNPSTGTSRGLRLESFTTSNLLLAPVVGVEWAFHDKWSLSFMPRVEFLLGPEPVTAISLPLVLSHSWFI